MKDSPTASRRKTAAERVIPPLSLRRLRADMELKDLSLADVARLSGIPYTVLSALLNGRIVNPKHLARARAAIHLAAMPAV